MIKYKKDSNPKTFDSQNFIIFKDLFITYVLKFFGLNMKYLTFKHFSILKLIFPIYFMDQNLIRISCHFTLVIEVGGYGK